MEKSSLTVDDAFWIHHLFCFKSQILLIKNVEYTKILALFEMFNKIENEISLFTYI